MGYRPGDVISKSFAFYDSNGALVAPDGGAAPVGTLYKNEASTVTAVTVTNQSTGLYTASATISAGYVAGDRVYLGLACTIGGFATGKVSEVEVLDTKWVSEIPALITAGTTTVTNAITAAQGVVTAAITTSQGVVTAAITTSQGVVTGAITAAQGVITTAITTSQGIITTAITTSQGVITGAITTSQGVIVAGVTVTGMDQPTIDELVNALSDEVSGSFPANFDELVISAQGVIANVNSVVTVTGTVPNSAGTSTILSRVGGNVMLAASYTAPPSAAANATAVRTELGVELGRIDVGVGTRLATASYTAAPTTAQMIAALKATTVAVNAAVGTLEYCWNAARVQGMGDWIIDEDALTLTLKNHDGTTFGVFDISPSISRPLSRILQ